MKDKSFQWVLVVEDDFMYKELFEQVFAALPGEWKIEAVVDGASAFAMLKDPTRSFAMALIDIGLPDMSGLDVISAFHQKFAELPILVTTSFKSEETFLTAIRAGAHGYLLKDESELSLANSIELVMQGQYPISPSFARYLFRLAGAPVAKTTSSNLMVSPRELELLQFISQGSTYSHCADLMNISLSTVQSTYAICTASLR
jgi:DNA-binding NarL/FixJ family response regulator